jgi:hypothetical protein
MQLYASKHIRFLYIITFLDSLLKGLQGFPTLKQIVSLNIGLKSIISDYNQGHIIRELRTRVWHALCLHQCSLISRRCKCCFYECVFGSVSMY